MRNLPRVITISGLAATGTTSVSLCLAEKLGWNHISAGQRFRQYAAEAKLSLKDIPIETHRAFDEKIKQELVESKHCVIEGRYLGLFGASDEEIFKVLLTASLECRTVRYAAREGLCIESAREALEQRDRTEIGFAAQELGSTDFLAEQYYNLILPNDSGKSIEDLAAEILESANIER